MITGKADMMISVREILRGRASGYDHGRYGHKGRSQSRRQDRYQKKYDKYQKGT